MDTKSFRLASLLIVGQCLALGLTGCGNNLPPLGAVSGTVTLDGAALPNAYVEFTPAAGGRPSAGVTDSSGRYTLNYNADAKGALVGKHDVSIVVGEGEAPEVPEGVDTDNMTEEELEQLYSQGAVSLPERYNSASELTADVVAGGNTIDFALTSD